MSHFGELRSALTQVRRDPTHIDRVVWWTLQCGPEAWSYTQRALQEQPGDLDEIAAWAVQSADALHDRLRDLERHHFGLPITSPQLVHQWLAALTWLLVIKRSHPGEAACLLCSRYDGRSIWIRWLVHRGYGPDFRAHPREGPSAPGELVTFDLIKGGDRSGLDVPAFPGQRRRLHDVHHGADTRAFVNTPHGVLRWQGLLGRPWDWASVLQEDPPGY